jgi:hypothetical protein
MALSGNARLTSSSSSFENFADGSATCISCQSPNKLNLYLSPWQKLPPRDSTQVRTLCLSLLIGHSQPNQHESNVITTNSTRNENRNRKRVSAEAIGVRSGGTISRTQPGAGPTSFHSDGKCNSACLGHNDNSRMLRQFHCRIERTNQTIFHNACYRQRLPTLSREVRFKRCRNSVRRKLRRRYMRFRRDLLIA